MLDQDEGYARRGRKGAEKLGHRLEPAGRGSDPDDETGVVTARSECHVASIPAAILCAGR